MNRVSILDSILARIESRLSTYFEAIPHIYKSLFDFCFVLFFVVFVVVVVVVLIIYTLSILYTSHTGKHVRYAKDLRRGAKRLMPTSGIFCADFWYGLERDF